MAVCYCIVALSDRVILINESSRSRLRFQVVESLHSRIMFLYFSKTNCSFLCGGFRKLKPQSAPNCYGLTQFQLRVGSCLCIRRASFRHSMVYTFGRSCRFPAGALVQPATGKPLRCYCTGSSLPNDVQAALKEGLRRRHEPNPNIQNAAFHTALTGQKSQQPPKQTTATSPSSSQVSEASKPKPSCWARPYPWCCRR